MRHPLHPALVHFPAACCPLAVAADVAGLWMGETAWRWSGWLLAAGCAAAVLDMLAGMVELQRVPRAPPLRDDCVLMGPMRAEFSFFTALSHLRSSHLLSP